jgi:predicted nucleic acid-binding protein
VKVAQAIQDVSHLFLDTAPVIYYVQCNPTYSARADQIFDSIDAGILRGVTSPITLAESLIGPIRQRAAHARQNFFDLIVSGANMVFVALDQSIGERAAELRVQYNLGMSDAFQIAAALSAGCGAFLTNHLALKRVRQLPILVLDELET